VNGTSAPERRGSLPLKIAPLQPWGFELCLRQDMQSGVLDLMQYDYTIPVDTEAASQGSTKPSQ
jgi:hypothetical protein